MHGPLNVKFKEIGLSRRSKRVAYIDNPPVLIIRVRMYMTKKNVHTAV